MLAPAWRHPSSRSWHRQVSGSVQEWCASSSARPRGDCCSAVAAWQSDLRRIGATLQSERGHAHLLPHPNSSSWLSGVHAVVLEQLCGLNWRLKRPKPFSRRQHGAHGARAAMRVRVAFAPAAASLNPTRCPPTSTQLQTAHFPACNMLMEQFCTFCRFHIGSHDKKGCATGLLLRRPGCCPQPLTAPTHVHAPTLAAA